MPNGIEASRHRAYKYFPSKKKLTLEFETDERIVVIDGYVETNDPIIFSKDEYTQISILCSEPYFKSKNPVETVFSGVDPVGAFEFPFSNESLDEKEIIMGELKDDKIYSVWYSGDADVGMLITMQASGYVQKLNIYNTDTREKFGLDDAKIFQITGGYIGANDIITISTVKGDKYARLQRGIEVFNILGAVVKDSDWIQLTQGENKLAYTAENGIDNLSFKIENYILYEGV